MSWGTGDPEGNRLLAFLPDRERRRIGRSLVAVPLTAHEVLHEPGRLIEHVHFPGRGSVTSLFHSLGDDRSFQTGLVGNEGMVGVEVLLGGAAAELTAVVLAPGDALRMEAEAIRAEVRRGGRLAALLQRYVQFFLLQFSQMAGCHRFHPLEQHFASLLLRLQDCSGREGFAITHELFAAMLGVRRVGISQAARRLQRAGLIRYRWGKVALLDRPGLETRACVCHQQIRQAYERLLGPGGPPPSRR